MSSQMAEHSQLCVCGHYSGLSGHGALWVVVILPLTLVLAVQGCTNVN